MERMFLKILETHMKILMLKSLLNKLDALGLKL